MQKFKKLLVTSLAVASVFSVSICVQSAQIESLSMVDNTIYATIDAENARLYAAECNEGLLSDVFFADTDLSGNVELPIGEASDYTLFLWDKDSLAPISATYNLIDDKAYAKGSTTPVPEYEFSGYSFNQEDNVMIVSAINESEIKGYKAGVETAYQLTEDVAVLGLSNNFSDVVPGSVVLIGTNRQGNCAAIELLASLGIPVSKDNFEEDFGTYVPSDGSTKYKNIVTEMYSKSGSKLTAYTIDENGKKIFENDDAVTTAYLFEEDRKTCYRVGIAIDTNTDTPIISCTGNPINTYPTIFEKTSTHHNYLYLRYNTETGRLVECVYYCVPKNFNPGKGDDEYTDIFNLKPVVIIE